MFPNRRSVSRTRTKLPFTISIALDGSNDCCYVKLRSFNICLLETKRKHRIIPAKIAAVEQSKQKLYKSINICDRFVNLFREKWLASVGPGIRRIRLPTCQNSIIVLLLFTGQLICKLHFFINNKHPRFVLFLLVCV
jgi:hypothetical protein